MNRTSAEVPAATAAPLLRVALIGILLLAALAGMLVASSPLIGWLALALAITAGPVAVMVDGRLRSGTKREVLPLPSPRPRRTERAPARLAA